MLEKRVKSRFSYKQFDFYNIAFKKEEDSQYSGLLEILKDKLRSERPKDKEISDLMDGFMAEKCTELLLKKYHSIGMNIDWFV